MRLLVRFMGFLFAAGTVVFLVGVAAAAGLIWHFSQDLPDYTQLKNYEPPVMTRVHAADGSVLAEYAKERRLYLPSSAIPPLVKEAFISVEGGHHMQGASTITQQVDKNFFLSSERSMTRKIREALLSFRIEATYSKEKILELYLNEIYLGLGNYGVA